MTTIASLLARDPNVDQTFVAGMTPKGLEQAMGEYADLFIEGLLDEETGELIDGDAPGYPRSPTREGRERQKKAIADSKTVVCPKCGKVVQGQRALMQHMGAKHS